MGYLQYFSILLCIGYAFSSVIIPEELPSLLSVAYSNIPPIKKGTDSRVGFGFAFGNHADFQVLFELGPQTNTNPISAHGCQEATRSCMKMNPKTACQPFAANTKRQVAPPEKINQNREKFLQSDAGKYLSSWAQNMKSPYVPLKSDSKQPKPGEVPNLEDSVVELVKNQKGHYEIHQPSPSIPPKALNQLKKLFNNSSEEKDEISNFVKHSKDGQRSKEEIKKITEDLSNVDLD